MLSSKHAIQRLQICRSRGIDNYPWPETVSLTPGMHAPTAQELQRAQQELQELQELQERRSATEATTRPN